MGERLMADDVQRLTTLLEARITQFEKNMQKASATAAKEFGAIRKASETATKQMQANVVQSTARVNQALASTSSEVGVFGRAFAVLAAGISIKTFADLADAGTKINNALKVAGLSGDQLNQTFDKLYDVAQRNGAPIESLAQLYSRVSIVQKELGVSSDQLIGLTDNVGKALKISGTTAEEASGSLLQLAQALGSGTVHAQDFNSIIEGMPALALAAAKGIKQANGSVAQLKALVNDQKISSKALFDGIAAGASDLDDKVQGANETIGQAGISLWNALTKAVRNFDDTTGAANKLAEAISHIAEVVSGLDFSGPFSAVSQALDDLDRRLGDIGNSEVFRWLNGELGATDSKGNIINVDATAANEAVEGTKRNIEILQEQIQNNTKLGFDNTDALQHLADLREELTKLQAQAANIAPTIQSFQVGGAVQGPDIPLPENGPVPAQRPSPPAAKQVDTDDPYYKPTGAKTAKGANKKTADDRFAADIHAIQDRTAALKQETELVGASYEEQTRRQTSLELEQKALADLREEARRKGEKDLDDIKLSPDKVAAIEKESAAYAAQAAQLRKVQEQQEKADQAADEFYGSFKDSLVGAIDGSEKFSDALSDILKKLEDMILNQAFDSIFQPKTSTSSGGIFGSLFSGIGSLLTGHFANGTPSAPGGLALVGEKGPEVVNLPRGSQVIPNNRVSQALSGGGGSQNVNVTADVVVSVDNNGNLQAFVRNTAVQTSKASLDSYNRQILPGRLNELKRNPKKQ
jgi:tape measure domain-containing protein